MTSPIPSIFRRAVAWLRRNPEARADALELAAKAARARADRLHARGRHQASLRAVWRAEILDGRAQQLRRDVSAQRSR